MLENANTIQCNNPEMLIFPEITFRPRPSFLLAVYRFYMNMASVAQQRMSCISIHSGYFYSASSSPLLLRGAPDTVSFTPKRHRQL